MKTFCKVPFFGLSAKHDGQASICCNINDYKGITKTGTVDAPGNEVFNLHTDSFNDIWNSGYMRDFRNKMLTGGYETACQRCISHEKNGVRTMRKKYNSHFTDHDTEVRIHQHNHGHLVSLPQWYDFRFSIVCDSSCAMCGPSSSSFLFKDWSKYSDLLDDANRNKLKKAKTHYKKSLANTKFIEQVKNNLDKIKFFEFRGGEPLVDRDVMKFITDISNTKYAKDIRIDIVTNGQRFPEHFIETLNKFKAGYLRYSIDGFDKVNEFIRWPAKWSQCIKTLDLIKQLHSNWDIKIITTMQVYNVLNVGNLLLYLENNTDYSVISNAVWGVDHLSPYMMPLETRRLYAASIADKFPTFANIIAKDVNISSPKLIEQLKLHNKLMERSRNINVLDVIPEMSFINE